MKKRLFFVGQNVETGEIVMSEKKSNECSFDICAALYRKMERTHGRIINGSVYLVNSEDDKRQAIVDFVNYVEWLNDDRWDKDNTSCPDGYDPIEMKIF